MMDAIFYLFHKNSKTKGIYRICSKNKGTFLPKYKPINFTKIFSLHFSGNSIREKMLQKNKKPKFLLEGL